MVVVGALVLSHAAGVGSLRGKGPGVALVVGGVLACAIAVVCCPVHTYLYIASNW